jgi:hypothetical protein
VYLSCLDNIEDWKRRGGLHEVNMLVALRMVPNHCVRQVAILGVEPETIDYGMNLTAQVAAALPRVVAETQTIVDAYAAGHALIQL